jgi:hypothetical protein
MTEEITQALAASFATNAQDLTFLENWTYLGGWPTWQSIELPCEVPENS